MATCKVARLPAADDQTPAVEPGVHGGELRAGVAGDRGEAAAQRVRLPVNGDKGWVGLPELDLI